MRKQIILLTIGSLFIWNSHLSAQTPGTTLSMEDMLAVFALQFDLPLPDTSFTEMEPGTVWEEAATEAKIMCNAMPAPFARVLQDTTEMTTSPEMILLHKGRLDLNGVPGYLIQMEFVQPEGPGNAENFEGLMYIRPLNENIALTVNVAYPKSQHDRLYARMVAAFEGVQQRAVPKGR